MGITVTEVIVAGPQGAPGTPGASTHPGGVTKQVLAKQTGTDYDVAWIDVSADDVTFTSTEGIAAVTTTTAIDEVEANRKVNTTAITANKVRGELTTVVSTNNIDDTGLYIAGMYNVTDVNNLPFSLTSGELTVTTEVTGGTDIIVQRLIETSDGKEYIRQKVGVAVWGAWVEGSLSALISSLSQQVNTTPSAISIATTSPLAPQVLVGDVAEKLLWMTSAVVDNGGTDISYDIPTSSMLIESVGIYKVYGVITANIPINDICEVELYVDNLPTGFHASEVGKGTLATVTFQYSFMSSFNVNDDIHLYVKSNGTEITIHTASVTIEKTPY